MGPPDEVRADGNLGTAVALRGELQMPRAASPAPKATVAAQLAKEKNKKPPLLRLHPDIGASEEASATSRGVVRG